MVTDRQTTPDDVSHVGAGMAKGAAWMVALRWSRKGLGFGHVLILAWIVGPEDFGLVAMAMPVYALFEVLGQFGFDAVLIQNQQADRRHYDTAWTLQLLRGVIIAGLLLAFAPAIAGLIGDPRLANIYYALAILAVADGCQNIGVVDFRKNMQFDKEYVFMFLPRIAMVATTIPIAFLVLPNYWALVIGIIVARCFRSGLSYVMAPYRPRLSLAVWREILNFSKWVLASSILEFVSRKADIFIIGRLAGAGAVGLYDLAREISQFATSELIIPVSRAVLPGYAKLGGEHGRLSWAYVNVLAVVLMLGLPLAAGIGLTGDLIIRVAFNERWLAAVPLVKVLAIYGVLASCVGSAHQLFVAIGRPNITTYLGLARVAVLLPLLVWGTFNFGPVGAAWALVADGVVRIFLNYGALYRVIGLHPGRILAQAWRTIASAAAMVAIVIGTRSAIGPVAGTPAEIAALLQLVAVGASSYVGVHLGLWALSGCPSGPERHMLSFARRLLARARTHQAH